MIRKRYYALKDALGFPIPGTMRGYNSDPCRCELVELKAEPEVEPGAEDYILNHPEKLHYFYQVDKECCNVLPNSLIISKQRPRGRYREFINYGPFETYTRTANFTRDNCGGGFTGSTVSFSKEYTGTDLAAATATGTADATFTAQGQAYANANGTCTAI